MLHIATVHFRSPRWIEIQARYLREHIGVPYQTWSSIEGIEPSYGTYFDRVIDQSGPHPGKLNHLAMEISLEAGDEDLLMFLDGDAFPIADPMPLITEGLSRAPLIAVRRAENFNDPQPHPCFCVTTLRTWRMLAGDWTAGPTWRGPRGRRSDVGANLMRRMEITGTPWVEVLRSNRKNIDPLYFAIYGEVVYHHGAGFRVGMISAVHRESSPGGLRIPRLGPLAPATRALNRARWSVWERASRLHQLRESERMFKRIQSGGTDWLDELM